MTSIFNVAIGLVFVFLLVNELWLSWLDRRLTFLEEGPGPWSPVYNALVPG
jgi:hypothetical protein